MNIMVSTEPEPMLKRISLENGAHLYLWRTPWCAYRAETKTWIPILDSNKAHMIPGEFLYDAEYLFYDSPYEAYKQLQVDMEKKAAETEINYMKYIAPSVQPTQITASKPPRFVAEIIKRDAVANKGSCAILMEYITQDMKTLVTPCFHIFDAASLEEWITQKGSCPACNGPVKQEACLLL